MNKLIIVAFGSLNLIIFNAVGAKILDEDQFASFLYAVNFSYVAAIGIKFGLDNSAAFFLANYQIDLRRNILKLMAFPLLLVFSFLTYFFSFSSIFFIILLSVLISLSDIAYKYYQIRGEIVAFNKKKIVYFYTALILFLGSHLILGPLGWQYALIFFTVPILVLCLKTYLHELGRPVSIGGRRNELLTYSFLAFFASLSSAIIMRFDVLYMYGIVDARDLNVFVVNLQLVSLLSFINQILIVRFSRSAARVTFLDSAKYFSKIHLIFKRRQLFFTLLASAIFFALLPFYWALLGHKYYARWDIIFPAFLAELIVSRVGLLGYVISLNKKYYHLQSLRYGAAALTNVILNITLVPIYGIIGGVYSYLITSIILAVMIKCHEKKIFNKD